MLLSTDGSISKVRHSFGSFTQFRRLNSRTVVFIMKQPDSNNSSSVPKLVSLFSLSHLKPNLAQKVSEAFSHPERQALPKALPL